MNYLIYLQRKLHESTATLKLLDKHQDEWIFSGPSDKAEGQQLVKKITEFLEKYQHGGTKHQVKYEESDHTLSIIMGPTFSQGKYKPALDVQIKNFQKVVDQIAKKFSVAKVSPIRDSFKKALEAATKVIPFVAPHSTSHFVGYTDKKETVAVIRVNVQPDGSYIIEIPSKEDIENYKEEDTDFDRHLHKDEEIAVKNLTKLLPYLKKAGDLAKELLPIANKKLKDKEKKKANHSKNMANDPVYFYKVALKDALQHIGYEQLSDMLAVGKEEGRKIPKKELVDWLVDHAMDNSKYYDKLNDIDAAKFKKALKKEAEALVS